MISEKAKPANGDSFDTKLLLTALTAVKHGDFSTRLPLEWVGLNGKIADAFNDVMELNERLAKESERASKVVGKEGKIGHRMNLGRVEGAWAAQSECLNALITDLTAPTQEMARVIGAVAKGDLTQSVALEANHCPLQGEFLRTGKTVNALVERLGAFTAEVTRVAREVGTEGKLGGQAEVKGLAGTWRELAENVNCMAANLTSQVRNIAQVTTAVAAGDLSKKITVDAKGEILELKDTINTLVGQLNAFASEVARMAREVGTDGKLGGQAEVPGVAGTWKALTDNVNGMVANLTSQVRNIADVTTAVAHGDLNRKITVDARGEILELKNTINTMVDQLNSFASEVTRVAREVGTDGKLGGQAQVRGVAGTWKDLTDNVNLMATNLTDQVRGIARVVTAVATGNLKLKLTVEARGEIASLADTINNMIDTLATFADQITGVAREVGVEGRLGGQANVPGAAGTWRDLTDNVNRLAANLTTQVRAIADVSTAVTKGDLSRSITVEAAGEVALLKDNVNEMIRNLKGTTTKNTEQDWLKSNLATFTRKLQGQRDLQQVCKMTLSELAPLVGAQHGVFYINDPQQDEALLKLLASYAYRERKNLANQFKPGEGLIGQCIIEKERILLTQVPGDYVKIGSGLGEGTPANVVVLPVIFEGAVKAVIELASFQQFSAIHLTFLDQLMESLGIVINTIQTNMRTEELLKQSQSLTKELQSQQEELQQTNEELGDKARLLGEQKLEVERKNREVEEARVNLEDKAAQLALTSKYKSEFLSNMSHELRTPLNSLLILSQQLEENSEQNLTEKQVKFAHTIRGAGSDLLSLINDILDLSKIESGTTSVDVTEVVLAEVTETTERNFGPLADQKNIQFTFDTAPNLPPVIHTDRKRLEQVLKNLLSNAFKFTEKGRVDLKLSLAHSGWSEDHKILSRAKGVIAFSVSDTGIGIPADKRRIIFEAFQQADGSTARKYGGTGLGLAISREIALLLGGELKLTASQVGVGSTFTLYLPLNHRPPGVSLPPATDPARESSPTARAASRPTPPVEPAPRAQMPADDRATLASGDRVVLIIEDDPKFAAILLDTAHEQGFKGVLCASGEKALALVRQYAVSAITLDIRLPDTDGWTVLNRLKLDPNTRHIPVYVISVEMDIRQSLERGAIACAIKPVTKETLDGVFERIRSFLEQRVRHLLVVEDNAVDRESILKLIGNGDVIVTAVATGAAALKALASEHFDCMVLDLILPDLSGFQVLEEMRKQPALCQVPVVVYTAKELTRKEETQLRHMAETIIIKGVHSQERLLDETALFLHRVTANLPEAKRQILNRLHSGDTLLEGKTVLIVDDDVRNLFALTTVLEAHRMRLTTAENGQDALKLLEQMPDCNVVLMDIMMPEMDGYETMRAIRKQAKFKSLPILALTAKAMKGDREKCLAAGANDYIAKPVEPEQLLSLLRLWLHR